MCNYRAEANGSDGPLDRLERDGLIRRSDGMVEVVEQARPLVRTVAAAFDSYLPESVATHVTAV
jgi:coproporphyrinogen III oxidase-like Fe-S oxidoreductase